MEIFEAYRPLLLLCVAVSVYTVHSTSASVPLPRPWLTTLPSSVLSIECNISHLQTKLGDVWNSMDGLELKFLPSGTARNISLLSATAESVKRDHLHPMASVELYTDHHTVGGRSVSVMSGLKTMFPCSQADQGTYYLDVHYTSKTNQPGVASHSIEVAWNVSTQDSHYLDVFAVKSRPCQQVNITWLPPKSSWLDALNVARVTMTATGRVIPFPPPQTLCQMTDNSTMEFSFPPEVLLHRYLLPERESCGVQNHTLSLFVISGTCLPRCSFTCEVLYPECNDRDNYPNCQCGAPPAHDMEVHSGTVVCDDRTTSEVETTTTPQPTTPSTAETELKSSQGEHRVPKSSQRQTAEPVTTVSVSSPRSEANHSDCTGACIAYRATAIALAVVLAGVFVLFVVMVVLRKNCRACLIRRREGHEQLRSSGQGQLLILKVTKLCSLDRERNGHRDVEHPDT